MMMFLALTFAMFIWQIVWKQLNCDWLELCLGTIGCAFIIIFVYPGYFNRQYIGSSIAIEGLQILVIAFAIKVLGYLELKLIDYIILTFCLIIVQKNDLYFSYNSMLFICGWALLCIIVMRRSGSLRGKAVPAFLSFLAAQISYIIYGQLFDIGIREFYYNYSRKMDLTKWQKLIFLGILTILFVLIMALILYVVKRFIQFYFDNINQLSKKYDEIGRYILFLPFLFGMIMILLDLFQFNKGIYQERLNHIFMILLVILFLGMQMIYLKLLFRTIALKEHLQYQETEKMNLQLYNQDISKNLQEIREMKHDLKNIFLTMGEYVARSEDKELKEYYYENIASFAGQEIRRNDLYVNLQNLQNESIKAFLYYKILQGYDSEVDMQLETALDHSVIPFVTDFSDIIRILGIFLDNAIEESLQVQQSFVKVVVKEQEGQMSISVKNKVRESVIINGIHKGLSSKGLGRGAGLAIVEKLVGKHSDILWNSYFQEDVFVQSISISK
jgi:Signal transduction histidine kinase regulating citrate/malate metabolism